MPIRACIKRCWSRIKIRFTSKRKLFDRELTEVLNKEYDARQAFLDENPDYPIHGSQKDREAYEKRLMGSEYDGCFEVDTRNPLTVAVAKSLSTPRSSSQSDQALSASTPRSSSTNRSSLQSECKQKGMVEDDIEFILTLNELVEFSENGKTTPNFENVKKLRGRASTMWL